MADSSPIPADTPDPASQARPADSRVLGPDDSAALVAKWANPLVPEALAKPLGACPRLSGEGSGGQGEPFYDPPESARLTVEGQSGTSGPERPGSPSLPGAAQPEPARLGQYQLLEKIGAGGMGTVFKALHTTLKRLVAVKILPAHRLDSPEAVARFRREMEAIGKLEHPNIIRATDAGEVDGCPFLVMELADGLDLSRLVRLLGPLPPADACELIRQAALGLQYVHEHHLVHRDMKPSNLLVTRAGQVKILDLGLARLAGTLGAGDELTSTGQVLGTADYMAPEQGADSRLVDIRADLYSLGCSLYKLLTGQAPFGSPEYDWLPKKLWAHAHAPVPPVLDRRPGLPADLTQLLGQLLAKDPDHRCATPAEVAERLRPLANGSDLPGLVALALERGREIRADAPAPVLPAAAPVVGPGPPTVTFKPPAAPGSQPEVSPAPPPAQSHPLPLWAKALGGAFLLGVLVVLLIAFRPGSRPLPPDSGADHSSPPPTPIHWPKDYPQILRDRPWGEPIKLLDRRAPPQDRIDPQGIREPRGHPEPGNEDLYQPVWCRRLFGSGRYSPLSSELWLVPRRQKQPGQCTLLALDDDLRRRWFDLEAELIWITNDVFRNPRGLFFGWQEAGAGKARAYFVHLAPSPNSEKGSPAGQLVVGPRVLDLQAEAQADTVIVPLPPFEGQLPAVRLLTERARTYRVGVRALPGKVQVRVNGEQPLEFEPPFDPRGALGIWVQGQDQGAGSRFRLITVTALAVP